jgi:PAS domain-containing protein
MTVVDGILLQLMGVRGPSMQDKQQPATRRDSVENKFLLDMALVDESENAIIATDYLGHIIFFNDTAERLYGWKCSEVRVRHLAKLEIWNRTNMIMEVENKSKLYS